MNINLTLIAQLVSFAVFVWFTMKFVWPPLVKAMDERKAKIADGLAAPSVAPTSRSWRKNAPSSTCTRPRHRRPRSRPMLKSRQ
jgi:hypothetical protein